MVRVIRHRFALSLGLAGLVAASVVRHRVHEQRDEPWVLGLGF